MAPSLRKPDAETVRAFLAAQAGAPFSHDGVGATRTGGEAPRGYDVDENRVQLGSGEATFARACEALRRWAHFQLGWVELHPADAPVEEGVVVAPLIRALGFWWMNSARLVYVEDASDDVGRRFAFAYGTLSAHVERGEERFAVEWRREDDSVCYGIVAHSRPRHPLVRLGYPLARVLQGRFVRDSQRAMLGATAT